MNFMVGGKMKFVVWGWRVGWRGFWVVLVVIGWLEWVGLFVLVFVV